MKITKKPATAAMKITKITKKPAAAHSRLKITTKITKKPAAAHSRLKITKKPAAAHEAVYSCINVSTMPHGKPYVTMFMLGEGVMEKVYVPSAADLAVVPPFDANAGSFTVIVAVLKPMASSIVTSTGIAFHMLHIARTESMPRASFEAALARSGGCPLSELSL